MSCDIDKNIIHYYKSHKIIKKINSCKKSREIFDINNPPIEKMDIKSNIKSNKTNNIKVFRESLFNHNNSSRLKLKQNIIKDKKFKLKFKNIFEPKILSSTWDREGMEVSVKIIFNILNNKDNIQKR